VVVAGHPAGDPTAVVADVVHDVMEYAPPRLRARMNEQHCCLDHDQADDR